MFSSSSFFFFAPGTGYIKIISMCCKVINIKKKRKSLDVMCGDVKTHSPSSSNASVRFGPESPKGVVGLKIAWRTALSCAEAMMPRSVEKGGEICEAKSAAAWRILPPPASASHVSQSREGAVGDADFETCWCGAHLHLANWKKPAGVLRTPAFSWSHFSWSPFNTVPKHKGSKRIFLNQMFAA